MTWTQDCYGNWTTPKYVNLQTSQLGDWTAHGLVKLRSSQLADAAVDFEDN